MNAKKLVVCIKLNPKFKKYEDDDYIILNALYYQAGTQ